MEKYTKVKHKLTGEEFLVLDNTGYGETTTPTILVRGKDYQKYQFQMGELWE